VKELNKALHHVRGIGRTEEGIKSWVYKQSHSLKGPIGALTLRANAMRQDLGEGKRSLKPIATPREPFSWEMKASRKMAGKMAATTTPIPVVMGPRRRMTPLRRATRASRLIRGIMPSTHLSTSAKIRVVNSKILHLQRSASVVRRP
jgi:hypothetical protein